MKNKIVICVLVVFLFLGVSADAKQKQQSLKQLGIEDIIAKMKTDLGLSESQVEEIKPIIENYLAQEKQLKLDEIKALGKVLTGDQLYAWNFILNDTPHEKKKK